MDKYVKQIIEIIKRIFNVATVASVGLLILAFLTAVFDDGRESFEMTVFALISLFCIAGINYIFFKKITVWHKQ